ncbi:hypothetical protein MUBE_14275 [Mycobacterium uberis]|uniref:Uncharacterized protein n=1 Tax=Mycobacterium uberis TaxID=2162698 RepID=A0A3E1HCT8_9MYCO|nr:hypothetical protein MUBE_14275 [Mycobacterium uberis]
MVSPEGWQMHCMAAGVRLLIAVLRFVIGRMTAGMTPVSLSSITEQVAAATARVLAKRRRTV